MLPLMAGELYTILWTLLRRFINKSVVNATTTAAKLSKIDVLNKENTLSLKKVDVDFVGKIILQEVEATNKASSLQVLEFNNRIFFNLTIIYNIMLLTISGAIPGG